MKIRILMQIRLNSTRLPAKALLPINGIPSAILAVRRAGNLGDSVLVVTSDESSDDSLCETLLSAGISCFRGSLNNVQDRFLKALADDPDEEIVVRLTGDNLLPDGAYIHSLIREFIRLNATYLGDSGTAFGLPYGLSAEVFTLSALRAAAKYSDSISNEHVTTYLRNQSSNLNVCRENLTSLPYLRGLRATMDNFYDYLKIQKLFAFELDPIHVPWEELCIKLNRMSNEIHVGVSPRHTEISRMTLGGAQLGIDAYGIANKSTKVFQENVSSCIEKAIQCGIHQVDCARAYHNSERNVGQAISSLQTNEIAILSKLNPFLDFPINSAAILEQAVDASVLRSLFETRQRILPLYLLHRWEHRHICEDAVWRSVLKWKQEKVILKIGASVQSVQEGIAALSDPEIQAIQLPFNILDYRWLDSEFQNLVRTRTDVFIYVRSAFLQGALLSEPQKWAQNCRADAARIIPCIDKMVLDFKRTSRRDLCLAYLIAQEWIDSIVIGADNPEQITEDALCFQNDPLSADEIMEVHKRIPCLSETILNPAKWSN